MYAVIVILATGSAGLGSAFTDEVIGPSESNDEPTENDQTLSLLIVFPARSSTALSTETNTVSLNAKFTSGSRIVLESAAIYDIVKVWLPLCEPWIEKLAVIMVVESIFSEKRAVIFVLGVIPVSPSKGTVAIT